MISFLLQHILISSSKRDPFTTQGRSIQNSPMSSFSFRINSECITEFHKVPKLTHIVLGPTLPFIHSDPVPWLFLELTRRIYTLGSWHSWFPLFGVPLPKALLTSWVSVQMSHYHYPSYINSALFYPGILDPPYSISYFSITVCSLML